MELDLREFVRFTIAETINKIDDLCKQKDWMSFEMRWVDATEAMRLLGIRKDTLRTKRKNKEIRSVRIHSRKYLYDLKSI